MQSVYGSLVISVLEQKHSWLHRVLNPDLLLCNPSFWPLDYAGEFTREVQKPNIDYVVKKRFRFLARKQRIFKVLHLFIGEEPLMVLYYVISS